MPQPLSPAETSLLRRLAGPGITPEEGLDPPTLEILAERGLVLRLGGYVRLSPEGRGALARNGNGGPAGSSHPVGRRRPGGGHAAAPHLPARGPAVAEPAAAPAAPAATVSAEPEADLPGTTLNDRQEDLLRALVQEDAPVPVDDLDGRVIRALEGRGLVRRSEGRVAVTEEGRSFYERRVRRRRRARAGYAHTAAAAPEADERKTRARLLRNAVEALHRVIGDAEEIEVGDLNATAADALAALGELADRIERGDDPRRIVRPARR